MINLKEAKKMIEENSLKLYEIEVPNDILSKGFMFKTLNELLEFCKNQNIDHCFINTKYTRISEYLINDELTNEKVNTMPSALRQRVVYKIREYNKELYKVDDSNPTSILLLVIYNSSYFYYFEQEELFFQGRKLVEPTKKIEEILKRFEKELREEKTEMEALVQKQSNMLRKLILNDPVFKTCTNADSRKEYAKKLYSSILGDEFKELKQHWTKVGSHAFAYRSVVNLVELLWREVKKTDSSK